MELRAQIAAITSSSKEGEQAEAEAGEGTGPQVNDQHIADIVAQWTGIPIDKVLLLPSASPDMLPALPVKLEKQAQALLSDPCPYPDFVGQVSKRGIQIVVYLQ